jgi:glyoxylase-like metal-dependent hydrolase (beta-lactamase superfamily II)
LLHTPGHRPDHLALYIPELATLLPGDAVETPFALLDEADPVQDLKQMRATLRRFLDLPIEWLLPNHAPPQPGSRLVRANLDYYERLGALAAQSESLEKLQESFPYSGPSDQEFYVKDHQRIVAAAWQAAQSSSMASK